MTIVNFWAQQLSTTFVSVSRQCLVSNMLLRVSDQYPHSLKRDSARNNLARNRTYWITRTILPEFALITVTDPF